MDPHRLTAIPVFSDLSEQAGQDLSIRRPGAEIEFHL